MDVILWVGTKDFTEVRLVMTNIVKNTIGFLCARTKVICGRNNLLIIAPVKDVAGMNLIATDTE